ncbi:MAG TPA: hypothetical protein VKX17_15805 [Planctomycetota bacterium]|nr:hypothetical protein [Planctomycetota bacterium]
MHSKLINIATLCALAFVCAPRGVFAAEDDADKKLLEALHSEDFDAREGAKKKLLERGDAVRELIVKELEKKDLDADYKDQLKTIASHLKDTDVLKAFDNPKRIDLELKDEPVSTALDKIKTQFGFGVVARDDAGKKKITLSLKGATFLEAVDAVRKAANLAYDRNEIMQMMFRARARNPVRAGRADVGDAVLVLRENGDEGLIPAAAKGPVLVFFETINYNATRSINFGNGGKRTSDTQKNFSISGYLLVEPELRFSGVSIANMRAKGGNLEALSAGHVSLNNYYGETSGKGMQTYNLSTNLQSQADLPAKLDWKMEAKIQVPVKLSEKRFDNLAEIVGKPQEFFGGTFTLEKSEASPRGWKIAYNTTGGLMDLASNNRGMRFNRNGEEAGAAGNPEFAGGMSLLDAQGKAVDHFGYSGSGGGGNYRVEMDVGAEPKSIVFRKPGEAQTRTFELEIPGVPVP